MTLHFELTTTAKIRFESGGEYDYNALRVLCGSGLAYARSYLRLTGGISADIRQLAGTVTREHETGVSLAVAAAIVKAIGRDCQPMLESQSEWELYMT